MTGRPPGAYDQTNDTNRREWIACRSTGRQSDPIWSRSRESFEPQLSLDQHASVAVVSNRNIVRGRAPSHSIHAAAAQARAARLGVPPQVRTGKALVLVPQAEHELRGPLPAAARGR